MEENISQAAIETEIAILSKEIELKKAELERRSGLVEEKDIVREAVAERVKEIGGEGFSPAPAPVAAGAVIATSYLDNLDEETKEEVSDLINIVFSKGMKKGVEEAKRMASEKPYLLDAFHDALADRLYDELKSRELIK